MGLHLVNQKKVLLLFPLPWCETSPSIYQARAHSSSLPMESSPLLPAVCSQGRSGPSLKLWTLPHLPMCPHGFPSHRVKPTSLQALRDPSLFGPPSPLWTYLWYFCSHFPPPAISPLAISQIHHPQDAWGALLCLQTHSLQSGLKGYLTDMSPTPTFPCPWQPAYPPCLMLHRHHSPLPTTLAFHFYFSYHLPLPPECKLHVCSGNIVDFLNLGTFCLIF